MDALAEVDRSHAVPEYDYAYVDVALFRDDGVLMNRYGSRPPGEERISRAAEKGWFQFTLSEAEVFGLQRGQDDDRDLYESVDGASGLFRFEVMIPGKCHLVQEVPVVVTTNFFAGSDRKMPIVFYDRPIPGGAPPADTDPPPQEYGGYETGQP